MATLNWIGKEAVVTHDKEVPFKLLEKIPKSSVGKESKNLIIHGDNLEALKALMPFYQGKVKCGKKTRILRISGIIFQRKRSRRVV